MKQFFLVIFTFATFCNFAQKTQKKYNYVIVPLQYGFTSEPNEFQLNVLTRMMLQKEGFKVYMSEGEQIPKNIMQDKCISLSANVVNEKGLFTTRLKFQLINCYGSVIYESEGESRKKAFKSAYQEALRAALTEFQTVSYKYVKKDSEEGLNNSDITAQDESSENVVQSFEESANKYTNGENSYWLHKENEDYILYLDKGKTVLATLRKAGRGTFSYDSEDIDGAAYFNEDGNLVVEYLAKNEDAVQKLVYKRQ